MPSTIRLFFDATVAFAFMAVFASIAAFATAAFTDDRMIVLVAATSVFVATGLILFMRLWWMMNGVKKAEPTT